MDTHEIILFGSERSERNFRVGARILNTDNVAELKLLLQRERVHACVMECDDRFEEVFELIAERRPDLTVALCEKFDFQRLVVATETARLLHVRLVAGLWRQSALGVIEDVDQLIYAERDEEWVPQDRAVVAPLRAGSHEPRGLDAVQHH